MIPFSPEAVQTPHGFSIVDSVITVSLNRSLLVGQNYSIRIFANSLAPRRAVKRGPKVE